jgi:hypothetical protein
MSSASSVFRSIARAKRRHRGWYASTMAVNASISPSLARLMVVGSRAAAGADGAERGDVVRICLGVLLRGTGPGPGHLRNYHPRRYVLRPAVFVTSVWFCLRQPQSIGLFAWCARR